MSTPDPLHLAESLAALPAAERERHLVGLVQDRVTAVLRAIRPGAIRRRASWSRISSASKAGSSSAPIAIRRWRFGGAGFSGIARPFPSA